MECEGKREKTERPTDRRLLIDYHERILATSASGDRRHRSERALERLRHEQLEEGDRLRRISESSPPASTFEGQLQRRIRDHEEDEQFETVWNGGAGLTSVGRE